MEQALASLQHLLCSQLRESSQSPFGKDSTFRSRRLCKLSNLFGLDIVRESMVEAKGTFRGSKILSDTQSWSLWIHLCLPHNNILECN